MQIQSPALRFSFRRKRITGILGVLPARERSFIEEMKNFKFPEERSLKLMEVMGYNKRRLVEPGTCVSDLAVFGLQHLFDNALLDPEQIDALILISHSPDHLMPPTSNIIQGRLGLKQNLWCLDIAQGCAGFVIGLLQAFMLLEQESIRKVVLINADVLSRKTSPQDRNIYPLVGDAAAITVVERDTEDSNIHANLKMDGSRYEVLMIPAGGMRMPSTPETAIMEDAGDNNMRAKDHFRMDGATVFNFVQKEVPLLIDDLLTFAGVRKDSLDYFLFHQPNRFMLQKLADKMKIPYAKMPNNVVENFGNSSGATIPMAIALNLARQIRSNRFDVCLAGFGLGLSWSAMLMKIGQLNFCDLIDYRQP